jgi:nucleoid DNA-binding protein
MPKNPKHRTDIGFRESCKVVDKELVQEKYNTTVSKENVKTVLEKYNDYVFKGLLEHGEFDLPYIGQLRIRKHKKTPRINKSTGKLNLKSVVVDWKATKEHGKRILRSNSHTNGYVYRIYWKKDKTLKNCTLYNFRACRTLSRALADYIFNKNKDYPIKSTSSIYY